MIDNNEMNDILEILENMADEIKSASLLKEFNDRTKKLGVLILNKEQSLSHEQWKQACDKAQALVDDIVESIKSSS
jgi:hypothetical protein